MGCVYFLREKGTNHFKIGHTHRNDPESRVSEMRYAMDNYPEYKLNGQKGEDVELVGYIPTDRHMEIEKQLHTLFYDQWIKSEWFEIEPRKIQATINWGWYFEINDGFPPLLLQQLGIDGIGEEKSIRKLQIQSTKKQDKLKRAVES